MKKLWRALLLSLLFGGLGLYLALPESFDLSLFRQIDTLHWPWLLVLAVVFVCWWFATGWRTAMLARLSGAPITLWQGTRAYLVGVFSAAITPAGSGNVVGIGWMLTRFGLPLERAVAITVSSAVLDMTFFAWSVPLAALYLFSTGRAPPIASLPLLTVLLSVTAFSISYLLVFRLHWLTALVKQLIRLPLLRRLKSRSETFLDNLALAGRTFAAVPWHGHLAVHAVSGLSRIFYLTLLFTILRAIGVQADLSVIALQTLVHAFAFLIPTPGGSGYQEGLMSWLLRDQVSPEHLSFAVIAWRFCVFYLYFLIGPLISGVALLKPENEPAMHAAQEQPSES